jgi:hypothetical protein
MVFTNCVANGLEFQGADDGLLASPHMFHHVVGVMDSLDGCYLAEDTNQNEIIQSGATEATFKRRWKEHEMASLLKQPKNKKHLFYNHYPDSSIANQVENRKGSFQSLQQLVGMGGIRTSKSRRNCVTF